MKVRGFFSPGRVLRLKMDLKILLKMFSWGGETFLCIPYSNLERSVFWWCVAGFGKTWRLCVASFCKEDHLLMYREKNWSSPLKQQLPEGTASAFGGGGLARQQRRVRGERESGRARGDRERSPPARIILPPLSGFLTLHFCRGRLSDSTDGQNSRAVSTLFSVFSK